MTSNQIGKQYSFPSVRVSETIRGPLPVDVEWRNTIGVAAPFTKGPPIARISDRKDIIALFGEDQSVGSVFLQQAMLQGSTDFVISRVIPTSKASTGSVSFQDAVNPLTTGASVGLTAERTVGLTYSFFLISDPVPGPANYFGREDTNSGVTRDLTVTTNNTQTVSIEFDGVGFFDVAGIERVDLANLIGAGYLGNEELVATFAATTGAEVQLITFADNATNASLFVDGIKPGFVFTVGSGSDAVFGGASQELEILSYAIDLGGGQFGVYVNGEVTSIGTTQTIELGAKGGATTGYSTIAAYAYRGLAGVDLPDNPITITDIQDIGVSTANARRGYLVIDSADAGTAKNITYLSDDGAGNLSIVDTGLDITFGESGVTSTLNASPEMRFTVSFVKTSVDVGETEVGAVGFPETDDAFEKGLSALEVLDQSRTAILNSPSLTNIIGDVVINRETLPYSLSFVLADEGTLGNLLRYQVDRTVGSGSPTDLNFVVDANDAYGTELDFVGGVDTLIPASYYFYDRSGRAALFVQAISPGLDGNKIKVSIQPLTGGEFVLSVSKDAEGNTTSLPAETFYLSTFTVDLNSGIFPETTSSKYIRAFFVPILSGGGAQLTAADFNRIPLRVAPIDVALAESSDVSDPTHPAHQGFAYLQNIQLVGGDEPTGYNNIEIPEADYIEAIQRLESEDVAFIAAPGIVAGDFRYRNAVNALVSQAENSAPFNGLRVAVIATPPRLTSSRAEILNREFNSPRVVLISGYSRLRGNISTNALNSSEGYYTGFVSNLPPHVSPAASINGAGVAGVANLDSTTNLDVLDAITRSNIEVLYFDRATNTVKFLNGRTTASDLDNRWLALRRYGDHLLMNLYRNLQWAKAWPNDEELRIRVASACDAFLKGEFARGYINNYSPTITDESINSPSDIAQGQLNILVRYIPKFPADYINLNVVRTISNGFSLDLNG